MIRFQTLAAVAMAAVLSSSLASAATTITFTRTDNGTTLPFQRHIVRLGSPNTSPGLLAAALQRNGSDGQGLVLLTSKDSGRTWTKVQDIQPDYAARDTADLVVDPDGMGFSMIYGIEPQSSRFVANSKADIVYLHFALGSKGQLSVDRGPIVVFQPKGSSQAYYRPSLTLDSQGTLHATASLLEGSNFTWWERISIDGGLEWTEPEKLASFGNSFGGGRIVAYGSKVMAIYDAYRATDPGRYRTKDAGPCTEWSSEVAFASTGLYHAGAFSALGTPDGRVHIGYSDKNSQRLWHREFNGSSWSSATQIESTGNWANQPSLSRQGSTIIYAWNRPVSSTTNNILVRTLKNGTWSSSTTLDTESIWKGYTSSLETVLPGEAAQILWSQGPADASSTMRIQVESFEP